LSEINALRFWREKFGMTQAELAQALKKSVRSVQRAEQGRTRLRDSDIAVLCDLFGVSEAELRFGPSYAPSAVRAPAEGFDEDAEPYDPRRLPGARLSLADTEFVYRITSDAIARSRAGLSPGDFAVFDVSHEAVAAIDHDRARDGTVVIAQAYDEARASADTIVRQWLGPPPGLLVTNRLGKNSAVQLATRHDIQIKGILRYTFRAAPGEPALALPGPARRENGA